MLLFRYPWRVESTEEIKWSPIDQPPMFYTRSYDDAYGRQGHSRIESDEPQIAVGMLAHEVTAVGVVGGVLYVINSDADEKKKLASPPPS